MRRFLLFILFVILFLALSIGLVFASNLFFRQVLGLSDDVFVGFLSFAPTSLAYIAVLFGLREHVDSLFYRFFTSDKCRVLLIGSGRSGKSTLVEAMLTGSKPLPQKSTVGIERHENLILLDLNNKQYSSSRTPIPENKGIKPIRIPTIITDYRGQDPSQMKFVRKLNSVVFLIDLFNLSMKLVEENREIREESEINEFLLKLYSENADRLIRENLEYYNRDYFGDTALNLMFDHVFNHKHTYHVAIAINKIDLLRELVLRGYLKVSENDRESSPALYTYLLELIEPIEERIREFCEGRGLKYSQVPIHFIGASTGENVNQILGEILITYLTGEDSRHGRTKRI